MKHYKHFIIGSVAASFLLVGCGETANTQSDNLSVRMIDVGQNYTNAEAVEHDYAALTLPKYINQSFPLPAEGIAGSDINWTLLNQGDLNITNHTLMVEDTSYTQYAKLLANINYDLNKSDIKAEKSKEFCVTVLPKATNDCEKVSQDITMTEGNFFPIVIDLNSTDAYKDCALFDKGPNDSNITWKLCDTELLEVNTTSNKLQVINPTTVTEKKCSTIKGTFQYGDFTKNAYFKVIVLPKQ